MIDTTVPARLTPASLTEILRAEGFDVEVVDVDLTPVGTGQMASSLRVRPTYAAGGADLPATFVAKLPVGEPPGAAAGGAYRKEVDFYRHLAPTLSVRVPGCWHAWFNEGDGDFLLLLDDLAPAVQGDQLAGCTPAEAEAAVVNLAGLHGPRWGDPTLGEVGLDDVTEDDGSLREVMAATTDTFVERFRDELDADEVETLRAVPDVIGRWLVGRSERRAPVHGDYRLDNLMFAADGSVTALDWQTVSFGLPTRDVAFLLSTGLAVDDRRAHERRLVEAYRTALADHGVEGYDAETCFDDYAFSTLQAPLIIELGWLVAEKTERGDAMFMAMAHRSCAAIRDLDTIARVRAG